MRLWYELELVYLIEIWVTVSLLLWESKSVWVPVDSAIQIQFK